MLDTDCTRENLTDDSEDDINTSKKRRRESDEDEEDDEEDGSSGQDEDESEDEQSDGDEDDNEEEGGEEEEEEVDGEEESDDDYESGEEESNSDESGSDEEETDNDEDVSEIPKKKSAPKATNQAVLSDSSAEEKSENREVCAICLSYMKGEIGSPELCDHSFCLECILEWARTNNSCPQDRTQFLQVFVRKKVKGKIIRTITVEEVKPDDIPQEDDEDPIFCEVCGRCDREDTLLLCDGCDSGHHLECLTPPLDSVPIEEWFCPECQALNRDRAPQEERIELREVTALIDEARIGTTRDGQRPPRPIQSRQLPRTRASERVRRRITRARTTRGRTAYFSLSDSENAVDENDDGGSTSTPNNRDVSTSSIGKTSGGVKLPPKKKRKVAIKRKRKVKRKTKAKPKRKTTKKTRKRKTTTKKRKTTAKTKRKGGKRKSTKRKKTTKGRKRKGKKKPVPQAIITPKARLAEALGIRPMKNPWQLSLPAMTGGRSQGGANLANQRWRAGLPSLSLLGSNSELDYVSEPDEFGDAILAEGVAQARRPTASTLSLARRKAMAADVLSRTSRPLLNSLRKPLSSLPLSDSNVSSVSDLLDDIIQSQNQLHRNSKQNLKDSRGDGNSMNVFPSRFKADQLAKTAGGGGPDSPIRESNNESDNQSPPREQNSQPPSYSSNGTRAADSISGGYSFMKSPSDGDPTGSKAYSSYLREHSQSGEAGPPANLSNKDGKKKTKKDERKNHEDEDIDLYSDIEPEIPEEIEDEEESENEDEKDAQEDSNKEQEEQIEENESPLSGDELIIDDSVRQEAKEKCAVTPAPKLDISGSTNSDNEVGSSNLPGLNDFELEAVSDTDTHEMDKSMNSSISLSDSNMGDAEVTSSTNELNLNESEVNKTPSNRVVQLYNRPLQNRFTAINATPLGMGLEGLETENISDNEEICFEDNFGNEDDNIEEGEIPNDNPHRALPANRPKINIQLRKVIEVSSPNKEFDGECEEGEIVDEAAAKKEKKREKAKREVDEVVNAQSDEPKEDGEKENVNPEPITNLTLLSEPDLSSPEKLGSPHKTSKLKDKKEKDKLKDKEKEKEKEKVKEKPRDKDVAFKKVSRNTKVRNYRDNDKGDLRNRRRGSRDRSYSRERAHSRDRAHSKDRLRDRERNRESPRSLDRYRNHSGRRRERDRDRDRKKEPKRKEMERYNVRQMINKKEEERKKKDEFGRDVALREVRPSRSRSRSKGRGRRRSESRSKKRAASGRNRLGRAKKSFSRSRSKSRTFGRTRRKRRSYSSSSSSSSSSSTSSSSSYTSSSSSSRSRSRSRRRSRDRKRHTTRSRSKSLVKKKVEKKKPVAKPKEKLKKVVVAAPKKKDEKKKEKRKEKEFDPKPRKKRKREKTPLQSKEVYQAGGSIMVSVNFSRNKENKDPKKKKDKDKIDEIKKRKKQQPQHQQKKGPAGATSPYGVWSSRAQSASPGGKHTPLQDEPMWSPDNLRHQSRTSGEVVKTPEVIDLDVIMVTPPPQEPILISDSEEDEEGITRLPPDLGAQQQLSPLSRSQGPKTPPEPGVKFTLSTKQVLKPITNPLRDEEEEDHSVPVPTRGPNTPPGPPPESDESVGRPKSPTRRIPRSPVGTPPASSPEPDVYDPFEPTKSPSPPTRSPQQEARVSSSDQTDQNLLLTSPAAPSPTKKVPSPPPPPLPVGDPPQKEERPPEPQQKPPEDEASSTAIPAVVAPATALPPPASAPPPIVPHSTAVSSVGVTTLPGVVPLSSAPHTLQPISTPANSQSLNTMQQIFAGLPANVANILYPAALAAAAMRGATNNLLRPPGTQALVPPDFSRPPPSTTNILSRPPPSTISPLKGDKGKVTQNGQNFIDVIDMDLGSPTSPDSSDASDMFEPPSPHNTVSHDKTSPRKQRLPGTQRTSPVKGGKHHDKFDALFGSSNDSRSKMSHKMKAVLNSSKGIKLKASGKKIDVEDDIPSSAVDLQVKEKLLKKVQRQERVVDEVKLCLKPFYNKKTISKEDYKDIMKKCVQKVCHNKSGEINPHKIRGLVEGYIKRVKYYRKKQGGGNPNTGILSQLKSGPILPPTVNDPPPPGFGLLSKTHLKMKP